MWWFKKQPKVNIAPGLLTGTGYAQVNVYGNGDADIIPLNESNFLAFSFTGSPGSASVSIKQLQDKTSLRQNLISNERDFREIADRSINAFLMHPHVRKAIEMKAEFTAAGFEIRCKDEAQKEFCDNIAAALNFDSFIMQMVMQLALQEKVYPWWQYWDKGEERGVEFPDGKKVPKWLSLLPPTAVEPVIINGRQALKFKSSSSVTYATYDVNVQARLPSNAYKGALPSSFLTPEMQKRLENNQTVYLDELESMGIGYSMLFRFSKFPWEAESTPGIYSILPDLILVELCKDIDFSTAAQVKSGVVKYSIGPGPGDANEYNRIPSKQAIAQLQNEVFKQASNPMPLLVTGNDVKIEWVVPPIEIYTLEKYAAAMGRIFDWLGIPSVFWPSGILTDKGSRAYASAYIEVKPFKQHIFALRNEIKRWLEKFLYNLCVVNKVGNERVKISFDANVLTEESLILRKVEFAATQGLLSYETTQEELDYDPSYEKERKLANLEEDPSLYAPLYDPKGGGPLGAPKTSDTVREPADSNPRPSRVVNAGIEDDILLDSLLSSNIEITNHYVKIPVVEVSDEVRKKYKDYRTGWLSKKKGIRAIYGIDMDGELHIVSIHFVRDKGWDTEKARDWIDEHGF